MRRSPVLAATLATATLIAVATGIAWLAPAGNPPRDVENAAGPAAAAGRDSFDRRSRDALLKHAQANPDDGRGWALLGYAEFEAERYAAAAAAFERAVAVSRKVAADPGVWCDYADALGMAQGGSLAGKPTELVMRALELRPNHPKALEMAGSAAFERRDFAMAASYWRSLEPLLGEGSAPRQAVGAAIARAERMAGTSLPPPR